jgi:hypothetical protein
MHIVRERFASPWAGRAVHNLFGRVVLSGMGQSAWERFHAIQTRHWWLPIGSPMSRNFWMKTT